MTADKRQTTDLNNADGPWRRPLLQYGAQNVRHRFGECPIALQSCLVRVCPQKLYHNLLRIGPPSVPARIPFGHKGPQKGCATDFEALVRQKKCRKLDADVAKRRKELLKTIEWDVSEVR